MPQIDRQVTGLNQDVYRALQAIKNPQAASAAEAKALRTAILKDGVIDDAETDLIAELSQDNSGPVNVAAAQKAGFDPVSLNVSAFDRTNKGQLAISPLALYYRKAEITISETAIQGKKYVQ